MLILDKKFTSKNSFCKLYLNLSLPIFLKLFLIFFHLSPMFLIVMFLVKNPCMSSNPILNVSWLLLNFFRLLVTMLLSYPDKTNVMQEIGRSGFLRHLIYISFILFLARSKLCFQKIVFVVKNSFL